MLIKDPYLASDIKNRSFSAFQPKTLPEFHPIEMEPKAKDQYISYITRDPPI
jgi:hypothetical protein